MPWLFGYLYLEILLRVILSWNNSKEKFLQYSSLRTAVEDGDETTAMVDEFSVIGKAGNGHL